MDAQQYEATMAAVDAETKSGQVWAGAPATAASTVDMVNTSGRVQIVDITAGTVTAVKVNGNIVKAQNAAVVAGRFRVPRGAALSITYSVVPTNVTWYYE